MITEIIAIGTELLMGYTINTNSATIGQSLLDIGIGVYYQQIVGDNENRLFEALELASNRSDLVILSGGLGPTRDDITKEVLAKFLNENLVKDEQQWTKIQNYFEKRQRQITETDYFQALTLENGHTFYNEVGLACGSSFMREIGGKKQVFITLPGPPFEMEHMLNHKVIPYLKKIFQSQAYIESLYLNFFGIGEAIVAKRLDDLILEQKNPTIAIYARPNHITIRLTSNHLLQDDAKKMNQTLADAIINRLESNFMGYGPDYTIEEHIVNLLKENNLTLSIAESITGGLILESLTKIAGVSQVLKGGYVTYTNQAKEEILGIDGRLIKENTVVSAKVAEAMASRSLELTNSDLALGITGVAGPDSLEGHPVGHVFIALARKGYQVKIVELQLPQRPRDVIRLESKNEALKLIKQTTKI